MEGGLQFYICISVPIIVPKKKYISTKQLKNLIVLMLFSYVPKRYNLSEKSMIIQWKYVKSRNFEKEIFKNLGATTQE